MISFNSAEFILFGMFRSITLKMLEGRQDLEESGAYRSPNVGTLTNLLQNHSIMSVLLLSVSVRRTARKLATRTRSTTRSKRRLLSNTATSAISRREWLHSNHLSVHWLSRIVQQLRCKRHAGWWRIISHTHTHCHWV